MSIDRTGGVCGFNRRRSDVVFSDFRGRRSRVQQISGDAARQGRAVQGATVSPRDMDVCSTDIHTHERPQAGVGEVFTPPIFQINTQMFIENQ